MKNSSKIINSFREFLFESTEFKLPPDAKLVWDKICKILPDLKSLKWHIDYGSGHGNLHIDPNSKSSEKSMSHLIIDKYTNVNDVLGDMQISYSNEDPDEEIAQGFCITTMDGELIIDPDTKDITGKEIFEPTMDPVKFAMMIDPESTTKYFITHKEAGWQKVAAKHLGVI